MRKIISTLAVAALLFAGATSCNKESGNEAMDTGAGSVKVKLSLNKGTLSRAASSARPTTAWSDMSNMMILFVTAGGTETAQVMDARSIAIPDMSDDATATFTDVKASDANGWDAYIVGNYPAAWTPGNVVGKRLSELTIVAPANPDYATSVLGTVTGTAYGESPEVFVAKQTGVKVIPGAADPTHPSAFKIARAVSMARVRIERNSTETPANATISFVDGLFAIRRATTTYGMFGTYNYLTTDVATGFANFPGTFTPTPSPATNVFFSNKGMV
jgi:hypothetical protein